MKTLLFQRLFGRIGAAAFFAAGILCSYGADRFTITQGVASAGGGTSGGGRFQVSGTSGQVLAATSTGGRFEVDSGFWASQLVNLPSLGVTLSITGEGDTLTISWPHSEEQQYVLEFSSSIGPAHRWEPLEFTRSPDGTTDQIKLLKPVLGDSGFLRLRLK